MFIFLDLDGVLVRVGNAMQLDDDALENLHEILEHVTNPKIVISSAWRYDHSVEELKVMLPSLAHCIVGKTPENQVSRGIEIKQWLEQHPMEDYIVIDDCDDQISKYHKGMFIKTDTYALLTKEHVKEIKRRFL
jgi:hypothetical protein